MYLSLPTSPKLADIYQQLLDEFRGHVQLQEFVIDDFIWTPRIPLREDASQSEVRETLRTIQRAYPHGIDLGKIVGFRLYPVSIVEQTVP